VVEDVERPLGALGAVVLVAAGDRLDGPGVDLDVAEVGVAEAALAELFDALGELVGAGGDLLGGVGVGLGRLGRGVVLGRQEADGGGQGGQSEDGAAGSHGGAFLPEDGGHSGCLEDTPAPGAGQGARPARLPGAEPSGRTAIADYGGWASAAR